jgi:1-deoxy-D-xylulose-5-phosphate synthase
VLGGLGSAILEFYSLHGKHGVPVRIIGVPDEYIEHGSIKEQRQETGLTSENVAATLKAMMPRIRKRAGGPA